jgi:hypothetical protein
LLIALSGVAKVCWRNPALEGYFLRSKRKYSSLDMPAVFKFVLIILTEISLYVGMTTGRLIPAIGTVTPLLSSETKTSGYEHFF